MQNKAVKKFKAIPLINQLPGECAVACVEMALGAFGVPCQTDVLLKSVPPGAFKWRNWLYALGAKATSFGTEASVVCLNTQTLDYSWRALSRKELLGKLKKELAFARKALKTGTAKDPDYFLEHQLQIEIPELEAMVSFVSEGGVIRMEPTTVSLLERHLDKGGLALASVDATLLYRTSRGLAKRNDIGGAPWGHVVLVTGHDAKSFLINDPASWSGHNQRFKVPKDLLVEAVTRRDQNVLLLKKKI